MKCKPLYVYFVIQLCNLHHEAVLFHSFKLIHYSTVSAKERDCKLFMFEHVTLYDCIPLSNLTAENFPTQVIILVNFVFYWLLQGV